MRRARTGPWPQSSSPGLPTQAGTGRPLDTCRSRRAEGRDSFGLTDSILAFSVKPKDKHALEPSAHTRLHVSSGAHRRRPTRSWDSSNGCFPYATQV